MPRLVRRRFVNHSFRVRQEPSRQIRVLNFDVAVSPASVRALGGRTRKGSEKDRTGKLPFRSSDFETGRRGRSAVVMAFEISRLAVGGRTLHVRESARRDKTEDHAENGE